MAPLGGPVRVLVIHPRDPGAPTIGGIQTFLHDFVKYSPPDFEITIAGATRDRSARPIGRRVPVAVDGRKVTMLALTPADQMPRDPLAWLAIAVAQVRLRAAMLRGGSILQVHRPYRSLYLAGHRGPRVQFVHVDIRSWPGRDAWGRVRRLYRDFSDRELRAMSHVYVVNEPGAQILKTQHPLIADRVEFLPVWFDPASFWAPSEGERHDARRELRAELELDASSAEDRLILFAGRLAPIKDPGLAIDAVAELMRDASPPVRLLIAGTGGLGAEIEARVRHLGIAPRTHLLGDVERIRLARIMRAADVLLLTSQAEGGGPRVLLEALASGLPVVAPPVGEVERTLEHMVNGWLFTERTREAVAGGLRWVLDQPRDVLEVRAVAAASPYTATQVLTRVYEAYRQLAAGGARRTPRWRQRTVDEAVAGGTEREG